MSSKAVKTHKESPSLSAMKEFGRVIAISTLPVVISQLEAGKLDLRSIIVAMSVAGLRAVEKYLHKSESKVKLPF